MRISDWSSDVCSSDLVALVRAALGLQLLFRAVDVQLGGAAQGLPGLALAGRPDQHRQSRDEGSEEALLQGLGPPARPGRGLTTAAGGTRSTAAQTVPEWNTVAGPRNRHFDPHTKLARITHAYHTKP